MAFSSQTSLTEFALYKDKFIRFQPDLVLIDLAAGESATILKEGFPKFIKLNFSQHIRTVLVEEPIFAG